MTSEPFDPVNPNYYLDSKITYLEVVDDWYLPHRLACAVKYIKRHRDKPDPVADLRKAIKYLELEIERLEKGEG